MSAETATEEPTILEHNSMQTLSSRQRWLAALDGQPLDRLPFWPKIGAPYARAQQGRFREMSADELHEFVGSDRHEGIGSGLLTVHSRCRQETARDDAKRLTTYHTPWGELRAVAHFEATSASWHPVEFPVKTVEDAKVMTEFYEDQRVEADEEDLQRAHLKMAGIEETARGIGTTGIGISPLMEWVQHLAGIENAQFLLFDHPEQVEALLAAMHRVTLAKAQVVAEHSPADLVYMVENTSTSIISPDQYRAYPRRHLAEYVRILRAGGKRTCFHMCGLLLDILPDIAELGATAWEAFTSPPVGNTRFADGRTAAPGVCIIGGTNAALWTRSAAEIIAEIERDLDALPHHRGIVVTSAGVMPPSCAPETIREVRDWVTQYPARS